FSARTGSVPRRLHHGFLTRWLRALRPHFEAAHQIPQLVRHLRQMLGRRLRFPRSSKCSAPPPPPLECCSRSSPLPAPLPPHCASFRRSWHSVPPPPPI